MNKGERYGAARVPLPIMTISTMAVLGTRDSVVIIVDGDNTGLLRIIIAPFSSVIMRALLQSTAITLLGLIAH
jgi:hypothetical protein